MIALEGRVSSLVIEPRGGEAPLWRWWGPRVGTRDLPPLGALRPPASFSLDEDVALELVPASGGGWFGAPALLAHRGGRHFAQRWTDCDIARDGDAIAARFSDPAARLTVEQRVAIDPATDVVTLSASIVNEGDDPLAVEWLAAGTLPLPADCIAIRSFTGRHTIEFVPADEPMPAQSWLRENRRGLTGHAGPPGLFVMGEAAGWHRGRVHAAQLAWSGNHRIAVERIVEGGWMLQAGAWLAPGEVMLAPGETYRTPELLAVCSTAGLNGTMQAFHAAIRARGPWEEGVPPPRAVHLNSWESLYFDHDEARTIALAERAAALGIERLVLDDGWFRNRADDRAGLGDWTPDPVRYPRGLAPVADRVTALGMEFGLWIEPEMVNPDSDLHRAHPEWVLGMGGMPRLTSRNQLVLDLGRAEVRDHLFTAIDALLASLPIAYLKWDHNRHLAPAGDADGRAGYVAQVEGYYALVDRIRAAHPAVEIEACAGGGGRIDAGVAQRAHRFWTSDNIDAVSRVAIQRGYLHFMPPERMGAHVGASPAHATGRAQALAFRAAVALPGHFGVELDPATLGETETAALAGWIERYKDMRGRLHSGLIWLGDAPDGIVWQAHGEPHDLLLFATRTTPATFRMPPALALPMLAECGPCRVRLLALAQEDGHAPPQAPLFDELSGDGLVFDGGWLAEAGLPLPAMRAESVAILSVTRA